MTETPQTTNPNDPSALLSPPNLLVKVNNTGRADLNGQFGQILSYSAERDRYTIALILPTNPRVPTALSFKPENLVKASIVEKLRFRAGQARRQMEETSNDPQIREAVRRAYTSVQTRLPAGLKPEYLLYAFLFALVLSIRYFGFSKTFLLLSLLSTPVVIAVPDLQSGMDLPSVVKNFPRRLRDTVVQITGFTRVTERMALGGFVLMFVLSAKVLITPYPTPKNVAASVNPAAETPAAMPTSMTQGQSLNMDAVYKMGFEDGQAGKEYGASLSGLDLSSLQTKPTGPRGIDPKTDDVDWAYDHPPRSGGMMSKFGIGKMMSMFAIFRTLKDLAVGPDGSFSLENLTMNLRRLDTWKLGMMAFCAYNVMRGLF